MADVFVSYSRSDAGFVRELHAFLTGEGRDVWVDWEDIPPASKWERDIDHSIDAAESFVFVASPASLASEYCAAELRHAQEHGKRIVPLAIDGASPEDAPAALRELNWIWCRESDDRDAAFAALTSALDTDLEWSRAHTRLLVRAVEWDARGDGSLLLRGKDLIEAERAFAENAGKEPRPTELQQRYLLASRRSATRRQRALLAGVTVALGISIALGIVSLLQRNTAIRERNAARSIALAAASRAQVTDHLDVGLLLGLEANRAAPSVQAESSMVSALEAAQESLVWAIVRYGRPVWGVAFSPDGRTLAAGGSNGSVRLWDLRARRQLGPPLRTQLGFVQSLAFSHDGKILAAGDEDSRVRLWNLRTRRPIGDPLTASAGPVHAVAFAPDDRTVAGVTDGQAVLWDVRTQQPRGRPLPLGRTGDFPVGAAFSPDGRLLVRGFASGDAEFWKVRFGDGVRLTEVRLGRTLQGLLGAALAAGNRTLAGFDEQLGVRLWDLRTGQWRRIVPPRYARSLGSLALTRDARTIAMGGEDGAVWLSSTRVERPATRQGPSARYTDRVVFTPDGRALSVGSTSDGRRVGASSGPPLADVDVGTVSDIALSPDGKLAVATARDRGLAEIWSVATGNVVRRLRVRADGVGAAAFSPDAKLVVTGDDSGRVRLWRVAAGGGVDLTGRMVSAITSVAFSPDGELVAAGDATGKTRLWEVASRSDVGLLDAHIGTLIVTGLAFSPDGTRLATGGDDARVRLWDVGARTQLRPTLLTVPGGHVEEGGNVEVTDLAFSPDGRTIATGNVLEEVRLWDVRSHQQLGESLRGSQVAFSPDGRSLLLAIWNGGTTRIWRGILWRDLDDLRARVCSLVWGNLTRAEWATYAPGLPAHATCG